MRNRLVRIRRESDDKETDITINEWGGVDADSLKEFAEGGNAYVVKWYDQTRKPWYIRLLKWLGFGR